MAKDVITGAWETQISGKFVMSAKSRTFTKNALYAYQNPSNPTIAYLGNDKNKNGFIDRNEVFGQFRIDPSYASQHDYPFPASGAFSANRRTGSFTMNAGDEMYGIGSLYNPASFF